MGIQGACRPHEAEAIGLKKALSWVIAQRYDYCIFEMDAQSVVNTCNGNPGQALFGTIV